MEFLDLPLELLTQILSHFVKVQHLAHACRVNKAFYEFEIRDFPKVSTSLGGGDLEELVLAGLKNCVNLRTSLNSAVLRVLQACDTLAELEINGHSDGHYDARILEGFVHLRRISLIMPSADVVGRLSTWVARTGPQLRSLTRPRFVTDSVLLALAPNLVHLEQFSLTGCLRVTHHGISAILSHNAAGLRALALEGLAPKFEIASLAAHCASTPTVLARLHSFNLSVHTPAWLTAWSHSPRARAPARDHPATDDFWRALVDAHGPRLTRVSVHRMAISLRAVEDVCVRCPALKQLFVVVDPMALDALAACLARAHGLAAVHINFPTTTTVERKVRRTDTGELVVERSLGKYESPDVPEQFLVVRT
ncbi:hypothetical protein B0H14DRAFT_3092546 [Mycena olivaceomarginata]|nr:hypothetical protein B0H14DRAFT_3092546 [Mycena olivaceomarginata]